MTKNTSDNNTSHNHSKSCRQAFVDNFDELVGKRGMALLFGRKFLFISAEGRNKWLDSNGHAPISTLCLWKKRELLQWRRIKGLFMSIKSRTIDNLGMESSVRYAKDTEATDIRFLEDSRIISRRIEVSVTKPYTLSEFDQLFSFGRSVHWALFVAPPNYESNTRALCWPL